MATPNRDAANEVYTPVTATRLVSSVPESTPSLVTDGTTCAGFNVLAVTRQLATATTVDFTLYYYDGNAWVLVEDSTLLAAADYSPTGADFFQQYNISGVSRYKFVVASADGTVRVTENLSV